MIILGSGLTLWLCKVYWCECVIIYLDTVVMNNPFYSVSQNNSEEWCNKVTVVLLWKHSSMWDPKIPMCKASPSVWLYVETGFLKLVASWEGEAPPSAMWSHSKKTVISSQVMSSPQKPNKLALGLSSLLNCERLDFCYLNHQSIACYIR